MLVHISNITLVQYFTWVYLMCRESVALGFYSCLPITFPVYFKCIQMSQVLYGTKPRTILSKRLCACCIVVQTVSIHYAIDFWQQNIQSSLQNYITSFIVLYNLERLGWTRPSQCLKYKYYATPIFQTNIRIYIIFHLNIYSNFKISVTISLFSKKNSLFLPY